MTMVKFELKQGRTALIIWSLAISFLLGLCVMIYPQMALQMEDVGKMFADMGGFSAAFGMDQVNFGEFIGFFGVECGNILGLGGAFFAALVGVSALSKEEKNGTAEFLLTHPVSRTRITAAKLCAVIIQVVILNLSAAAVTALSVILIDETVPVKTLALIFIAHLLMQIEVATVTFGISAFLKRSGMGIGLGLAAVFYFLNILSNLMEELEGLKYVTPFGFTDGAQIIADGTLNLGYLTTGVLFTAAGIVIAFCQYRKKDIG